MKKMNSTLNNVASLIGELYESLKDYAINNYPNGEDLLHDALIIAMEKFKYNIKEETLEKFVKKTIKLLYLNSLKKKKLQSIDVELGELDEYNLIQYPQMKEEILKVIKLTSEGYSAKEIAGIFHVHISTVYRWKQKGLKKIKQYNAWQIKKYYYNIMYEFKWKENYD